VKIDQYLAKEQNANGKWLKSFKWLNEVGWHWHRWRPLAVPA